MEKGKRIEAELELPEEIIQHIQCFLNGKEAAQTTLVSKSWYAAWLTRPNLVYNTRQSSEPRFLEYMKKTVERYETLNLKIDSLRLWIHGAYYTENYSNSLVKEFIMKALKMGATSLDFKVRTSFTEFTLPHEVFGSKNLVKLSLGGCKIGTGGDGKVSCSRLKSLSLERVVVESDLMWNIIYSCPLIEDLSLSTYNNYDLMTLNPFYEFGKRNVGSVVDSLFNKLKSLVLTSIYDVDFSSKFPCLKDLTLHDCGFCGSYKDIQVSSPSLECISFIQDKFVFAKFDVPNIRKFTYSGPIPSLSFKTTSTNWRSHISIKCPDFTSGSWILDMNILLTELSQSKVSLSLQEYFPNRFDCAKDISCLRKPGVENLMINEHQCRNSELLDALFRWCRPIYVTQDWSKFWWRNCDFMEFVYKRVMQHVGLKCSSASQSESASDLKEVDVEFFDEAVPILRPRLLDASTCPGADKCSSASVCYLEEVDVEYFDEAVSFWRPRLLDASTCPGADKQRIRLHLKWTS